MNIGEDVKTFTGITNILMLLQYRSRGVISLMNFSNRAVRSYRCSNKSQRKLDNWLRD
jgi:hypothetical protein